MKAFLKHYFRFMLIYTLLYFFILILVNLISGDKEIIPTAFQSFVYGFSITFYFFMIRFIKLKKLNISVFSGLFFTSNPSVAVKSRYNLDELKKMIITNHEFKMLRVSEKTLKFKKTSPFNLYARIFEVKTLRFNGEFYDYSINSLGWNSHLLDDLGSNLETVLKVKKMLIV
jgi:hypothetical protein